MSQRAPDSAVHGQGRGGSPGWFCIPILPPDAAEPNLLTILVADFDNRTGDTVFDGALEQALAIGLEGARPTLFVSFNGRRFDVPYLNIRSAIHGIEPAYPIPLGWSSHFDVREALEGDDKRRRGNLDYFCAVFGVPSPKTEMDGSLVGQVYAEGRIEDIERYCLADCRATLDPYRRLRPFYGGAESN